MQEAQKLIIIKEQGIFLVKGLLPPIIKGYARSKFQFCFLLDINVRMG